MSIAVVFAFSLFISAALLFWVEPLIAKMLLPFLGGAPAVWNVCMVFFQSTLLLGYLCALAMVKCSGSALKNIFYFVLIAAAAIFLPFAVPQNIMHSSSAQHHPALWLLLSLLGTVGFPFFIVSTCSPLLQHWFSRLNHPSSGDPYFLFAAANLGSLTALFGFPFIMEPGFTLNRQSRLWALGYAVLAIMIAVCFLVYSRHRTESTAPENIPTAQSHSPSPRRRMLWAALAFVPSSLMLGVTEYISTDIAAVPLLWVIPLALYLLTFVLVFAKIRWISFRRIAHLLPGTALIVIFVYLSGAREPGWFLIPLNLVFLFIASAACHGRLAEDRPHTRYLVEYYIWIAAGGMGGGISNGLVAPVVFSAAVEYPLVIAAACLLLPAAVLQNSRLNRRLDLVFPLGIGTLTILLASTVHLLDLSDIERIALVLGIPIFLAYLMRRRPIRFGLSVAAVLIGSLFYSGFGESLLHRERNFFGILKVAENRRGNQRLMYHGNTVHGKQFLDAARQCEPLAYYHRNGPLGSVFESFNSGRRPSRIAGIGLGVGAMVSYSLMDQEWTFYEINPAVIAAAQNESYFTYLSRCAGAPVRIIVGDARLRLQEAPDARYDLIVLDAFSSDAIPIHLITKEAIELYLSKLASGGMIAFHISNRNMDLRPVLAGAAQELKLDGIQFDDKEKDAPNGKDPSLWAVLARNREDLGSLAHDSRWMPIDKNVEPVFWSDDFSNILGVLKWLK
jgi:cytochrome c-type biogenesis protein CcmH/NrfF